MAKSTPFTDIGIRNLKARDGERVEVWDDKIAGLGVRVSAAGTKSFVLLYRIKGSAKRMTLGRYPVLSLGDARKRAQDVLYKISHGGNPQAEKQVARSFPRFDKTLEDFVRLHCQRKNRESTARETERLLRVRFLKPWAARDVREITKRDVNKILDGIVDAGTPGAANHAFAAVRKFFSWCVQRGIVDASPCAGVATPSAIIGRERVLSDAELVAVWNAADEAGYPYASIVKLLILTGQRRSEVTGMLWSELSDETGLWSLPSERTKNGRAHQVPLLAMATAILDEVPRISMTYVFPARGNDDETFSGFSKSKHRLDRVSGVANWTLHDLRRTTATGMAGLGVPPHVVEKLLNHSTGTFGGVAGIYNRFQYVPEMREALAKWENRLQELLAAAAAKAARIEIPGSDARALRPADSPAAP
jgi:integrase